MTQRQQISRPVHGLFILLLALVIGSGFVTVQPAAADTAQAFARPVVLIGGDGDNMANPVIQPGDSAIDQSLNNADVLLGGPSNDVLIGMLGSDVLDGGPGDDVLIGGVERGNTPNSDVVMGGSGDDVSIWAPGDGSDAFLGGEGKRDAMVFGVLDRDEAGVPVLTEGPGRRRNGLPTANVTGQGGFCELEAVDRLTTGFDYLVRFTTFSDGLLKVTVRLRDVEQLFCTAAGGGAIAYVDLTAADPAFVIVDEETVAALNPLVAQIIR